MYFQQIDARMYEPPRIQSRGRFISADPFEMRILDIVGSLALLIVFAPLMLLIMLAVFLADPGPVFFQQNRIGRNGRMFKCYKFRTMAIDAEDRLSTLLASDPVAKAEWDLDHKLRKDPRVVGIGNFLRRSSLDELPQLFNVLKADMSLVGPRPIVASERYRYGKYFAHYCSVRPGITGLWQVNGRNDVSYRRRVAFDVLYARKGRTGHNVGILLMTIPSVLGSKGSY